MENKVKLSQNHINLLSSLPEQGMGYQIVDITLTDDTVLKERIVINSSYLKLLDSENINVDDIKEIGLHKK